MSKFLWCGVVVVGMSASVQAQNCPVQALPTRLTIDYEASAGRSGLSLGGEATLQFSRELRGESPTYVLTTHLNAAGVLTARQTSVGTVRAGHVRPDRYTEVRTRRPEASTAMDWSAHALTLADGTSSPLPPTLQDRASAFIHLMVLHRTQPEVSAYEFPVASLRRVAPHRFVRKEATPLDVPLGVVDAVRYEHLDAEGGDHLEVWLSPQYCGAPVRIRLRDHRGQDIEQRARSVVLE